ncbi:serine hydrolase [Intrasporangium calvum]|uniref:Beta-lactamase related protein n=1 Tax=Intrasporangium calvum (strain ATCC 23552 / DSM 43043 / JCM 3097 / NBRC 12989 / NCIMB 10167 / NRRL B-3866 / 7 KIP) TaxID=710696 RepID=E6S8R8_INTC7|nr:serine hydrolase [Intrasporangium calvum]ADU47037.1 beta-lactamase related protein [Intrasporangium calvum DSM 43043]
MPLSSPHAHVPLRTGAVGTLLLLLAAARRVADGAVDGGMLLRRTPEDVAGGSGIWRTLAVEALPLVDVAALVGAVRDNLATNVLLRHVGLSGVADSTASMGLMRTGLHDRVRAARGAADPESASSGTALELCWLAERLMRGSAMGGSADRLVRGWLSANVDQSMVGAAFVERFGVDPLAHHASLGGELAYWNTTGTEPGVRADIGAATWAGRTVAWTAIANWAPELDDKLGAEVLAGMRSVGDSVIDFLTRTGPSE